MKIVQTRKDTLLVEMTRKEFYEGTGVFGSDQDKFCEQQKAIDFREWAQHFSRSSEYELKNVIGALDGASNYLSNQLEALKKAKNATKF